MREDYYGTGNVSTLLKFNDAASTTATSVTTKKTRLLGVSAQNGGSAAVYLRLYDKASAPVPGTDVPKIAFMVPPGGGLISEKNMAVEFTLGLALAVTSGGGNTNAGTIANANEVVVNLEYYAK